MRINLDCPFSEKDNAKALGARWDVARKTWYIENVEDLTLFMRWIGEKPKLTKAECGLACGEMITLRDFLDKVYGTHVSLTFKAANQFGIPWPLSAGWKIKYADKVADLSKLTVGKKKAKGKKRGSTGNSAHSQILDKGVVTGGHPVSCGCAVLPWEDCEHSDALADKAMRDILVLG